jgi:hypothetical protein
MDVTTVASPSLAHIKRAFLLRACVKGVESGSFKGGTAALLSVDAKEVYAI